MTTPQTHKGAGEQPYLPTTADGLQCCSTAAPPPLAVVTTPRPQATSSHSCVAAMAALSAVAALAMQGLAAQAATVPTSPTFSVTASVVQGCIVFGDSSRTSAIPFGAINFGTHPALGTGTVNAMASASMGSTQAQLLCTPGTTVQVSVDGGQHLQGTQRRMSDGLGRFIAYSLALVKGTPAPLAPNASVGLTMDGTPTVLPIRGTVALPGTGTASGIYTDSVQVLVSW